MRPIEGADCAIVTDMTIPPTWTAPHVVVVGGGFGGLAAARGLADADVRVTVIDRRNHHLFQPLLYQVATAGLNPSDIAHPIRSILADQAERERAAGRGDRGSTRSATRSPSTTARS